MVIDCPLPTHPPTQIDGVHCDLNFGGVAAVYASSALARVLELDARTLPLLCMIKAICRAWGVNNSMYGTLSSYGLCLLMIFHLQTRREPVLPPLRQVEEEEEKEKE